MCPRGSQNGFSPAPHCQIVTEHAHTSGRLHEFIFSLFLGDGLCWCKLRGGQDSCAYSNAFPRLLELKLDSSAELWGLELNGDTWNVAAWFVCFSRRRRTDPARLVELTNLLACSLAGSQAAQIIFFRVSAGRACCICHGSVFLRESGKVISRLSTATPHRYFNADAEWPTSLANVGYFMRCEKVTGPFKASDIHLLDV